MKNHKKNVNREKTNQICTMLHGIEEKEPYFFAWLASEGSKNSIATRPSTELRAYPASCNSGEEESSMRELQHNKNSWHRWKSSLHV